MMEQDIYHQLSEKEDGGYGKFRCMLIFIGSGLNEVRKGRPWGI
jgi:hypothetical protein